MGVLRSNASVRNLFFAQNISVMGDYLTYVALVGLVKDATDSTFLVSLIYAAYVLPSFFFSPIAGPIVDKFDRRKIIVVVSALQAVCGVGFLLSSADRIWLALLTQIVISSLAVITLPAFGSALPNVTRNDEELRQANALFGSSWGASVFIGSALGGLFAATFGRTATFVADIATFAVCAGLIALIKVPMQERKAHAVREPVRPIADMREAFHYAKENNVIFALMASKTTQAVGAGAVGQLAVLAIDAFNTGDGGSGLLLAARGFGAAIGPFIFMRFARNNMPRLLLLCGIGGVMWSMSYLAASGSPTLWLAVIAIGTAHIGGGAIWTMASYGLQTSTEDHIRGRVLAGDMGFAMLVTGLSSIGTGILGEIFPIRIAIAIVAGISGMASCCYLIGSMGLRKRLRSEMLQQPA
jgi:predicted MFS family arabinose efflux permease